MFEVRYEGLRELAQALRVTSVELYGEMVAGLAEAGDVIRRAARSDFIVYGASTGSGFGDARAAGFVRAADGFQTLVRTNTSTMALVSVAQTRRRTPVMQMRRSNFGDLMMRHALLPARGSHMEEAAAIVDRRVGGLLERHGF